LKILNTTMIEILGKTWEIVYLPTMQEVDRDGRNQCWGHWDPDTRKIRIWAGMTDEDKIQTLIHEIIHIIASELGFVKLANLSSGETKANNEVDALALGLMSLFVRNGLLR
jgi:hypothetical protein